MLKISIVPDTNVLLSRLEIIKELYKCSLNVQYTINYSKTVLNELDGLKKKNVQARNAIKFIESVTTLLKTEIEGKVDDRKMDVVVEAQHLIKANNNDDKILNYCFQLENPIFLTSDKAFILKCDSFNIKSIKIDNKKLATIIKEVQKNFGLDNVERQNEAKDLLISRLKQIVKETIEQPLMEILARELGNNYELLLRQENTLEYYCELIASNFFLFKDFLPQKAPKIFKEFLESIKQKNLPKMKQLAAIVCLLFRKTLPDNIL